MIVPQYWAEARRQHRKGNRQITVRRFGWSDESQQAAQALAESRAEAALARLVAGERLARSEPKIPYNGAEGVPIREEIVSRHREVVITRNSYGAKCLNTPNVFFADIDFEAGPSCALCGLVLAAVVGLMAAVLKTIANSPTKLVAAIVAITLLVVAWGVLVLAYRLLHIFYGGEEQMARAGMVKFVERNPEWHLRLYRTPAGLRLLAMHKTFEPGDPAVAAAFKTLGVDPVYAKMCLRQKCFRARVSPKPWRIGIGDHLRPRPGVWPVAAERLPLRNDWLKKYDAQSRSYASCRYLESLGSGITHPEARFVQELHDELCASSKNLPIA